MLLTPTYLYLPSIISRSSMALNKHYLLNSCNIMTKVYFSHSFKHFDSNGTMSFSATYHMVGSDSNVFQVKYCSLIMFWHNIRYFKINVWLFILILKQKYCIS